jgi:hypothetical protein
MPETDLNTPAPSAPPPVAAGSPPPAAPAADTQQPPPATPAPNVASGNVPEPAPAKPYWPDDWRDKAARRVAGDDADKVKKELDRLAKIDDPASAYAMYRQIENTWASRNFVKLPPKEGATESDIKDYHKAIGVPEKAEDYVKDVKLESGAVIGEMDKPIINYYAGVAHKAGMSPAQFNGLVNAYYAQQEEQATKLDEADDNFRRESNLSLKEEYGPAFKRMTNSIKTVFKTASGGVDVDSPSSTGYRLLNGRTADGKIIGNDPEIVRWLVSLATEMNPADAVVEDGGGDASVDSEIEKIEKVMRENRAEYDKKYADRYLKLIEVRNKIQARKKA